MQQYALIIGHGRSGTNWLLSIMDASPVTHCRNEPNEIPDSPFKELPTLLEGVAAQAILDEKWDKIVRWTATTMGERDARIKHSKNHVNEWSRCTGLATLPTKPRLRSALRKVLPAMQHGEWPMPWWIGREERLEQAYAILKINQAADWAVWVMKHRPEVPVLHIVRHPGGRLNSWRNRFQSIHDTEKILADNKTRLHQVITVSPEWVPKFGDIDNLDLVESEIWFWRYVTEAIHTAGKGHDNYLRIIFEDMANDPIGFARNAYSLCNLSWTDDIENIIRADSRQSISIAGTWKDKLTENDIQTVNHILKGSMMEHWWEGNPSEK